MENYIVQKITQAAQKYSVSVEHIHGPAFILHTKAKTVIFSETTPETTPGPIVSICKNKMTTRKFLERGNFPIAPYLYFKKGITDFSEVPIFLKKHKCVVVKPIFGIHGKGITTGITSMALFHSAIKASLAYSPTSPILVEKHLTGNDYRILVIGKKDVFCTKKEAAFVVGDGQKNLPTLIDAYSKNTTSYADFSYDSLSETLIATQSISRNLIPTEGRKIYISMTSNLKSGGTSTIFTEHLPQHIKNLAIAIVTHFNMDVAGIDIMSDSDTFENFHILEINHDPGLRLHLEPTFGKPEMVHEKIVSFFFK